MINRYSSRTLPLDESLLNARLLNAKSYDRVAGYFSSSILEIAGESINSIQGTVRIICNSEMEEADVVTARAAEMSMKREWCNSIDTRLNYTGTDRFSKLYSLLTSNKIEVRVLPSTTFGLIHGKIGVVTGSDGKKMAFIGSTNETYAAWRMNYEVVWEDDSPEAVEWAQSEFDALWQHPHVTRLSDFIIQDIGRIAKRKIINLDSWQAIKQPASVVVESPVYRSEYGLWAHQKYFVKKAFDDHLSGKGARYLLADQVGLGKTVQLALSAQLMALTGSKPVLIIVPRTLLFQWQDEMNNLLAMPSAVWDGKQWNDENGVKYPSIGPESISKCPRRVGIVSQGLITRKSEAASALLNIEYECIILDECHRARRKNLKADAENEPVNPNNLLAFLFKIASQTKNLLIATATPVQLFPIEAYDLLDALSRSNDHVLGNVFSLWKKDKKLILDLVTEKQDPPMSFSSMWEWVRNPFPATSENDQLFGSIRRRLNMSDKDAVVEGNREIEMKPADKNKIERLGKEFFTLYNPFIRHIVRRTREFLENENDPSTGEPYLKKVEVTLFGEDSKDAILLPGYLRDAYESAEEFCRLLGERMKSAGFMKTMLLRRMGSSLEAGKNTTMKILGNLSEEIFQEEDDNESSEEENMVLEQEVSSLTASLTNKEKEVLQLLLRQLEKHQDKDPKYFKIKEFLFDRGWMESGCILFSQYFDTCWYMANQLSSELKDISIGVYAGGNKSGLLIKGIFTPYTREDLKKMVQAGKIRLLFGTDAASEGLNLQKLGTLINIDLPWNPTRLEQRKGRIQRIGQIRDKVLIYNMRYKDSIEDKVHGILSSRLKKIYDMFGQLPDVLEDVWIEAAQGHIEKANEIIDAIPNQHPFEMKYNKVEQIDWESCSEVLNEVERREILNKSW
ncbi:MAG TPA: phospholipase D-like domain-containing protein [Bacteroidales bacterium]|nr:phospholipase D-like domain-containing protein [Bacteroidales bacterium]HSA43826.1 phospholipase D-like domain-containing protein [Bacteroidales bacterium]